MSYTCPNCDKSYEVRPKACDCERSSVAYEISVRYYKFEITDRERATILKNTQVEQIADFKEAGQYIEISFEEAKPFVIERDPLDSVTNHNVVIVLEYFEPGVETVGSSRFEFYAVS